MFPPRSPSRKKSLTLFLIFVAEIALFSPALSRAELPPQQYPGEADLAVNGVFLKFRKSAEDVLGRDIAGTPGDGYEQLVCLSRDGSEMLTLLKRRQAEPNSFHRLTVSKNSRPVDSVRCRTKGPLRSFRGVVLGMSMADITKIFGNDYQVEDGNGLLTIRYSIENSLESKFLQYYQERRYYGFYRFKGGKLAEFSVGFDPLPASLPPAS